MLILPNTCGQACTVCIITPFYIPRKRHRQLTRDDLDVSHQVDYLLEICFGLQPLFRPLWWELYAFGLAVASSYTDLSPRLWLSLSLPAEASEGYHK